MRVLFVWEVAGVASILAKYLRERGHICNVVMRKSYDSFGFTDFYKELSLNVSGNEFDEWVMKNAEVNDVIHVNSAYQLAYRIKKQYPDKKVILEYHGSDARLSNRSERSVYERQVDKVLVSTPDLLANVSDSIWLPLTVDFEHFAPRKHQEGAVFFKADYYNEPKDIPFTFTALDLKGKFVPYAGVPQVLEEWDTYIDIQDHIPTNKEVQAWSKMGLEALACGMKVFSYQRQMVTEFPKVHKPDNVIDLLEKIYVK
jgi:hypothetical protein